MFSLLPLHILTTLIVEFLYLEEKARLSRAYKPYLKSYMQSVTVVEKNIVPTIPKTFHTYYLKLRTTSPSVKFALRVLHEKTHWISDETCTIHEQFLTLLRMIRVKMLHRKANQSHMLVELNAWLQHFEMATFFVLPPRYKLNLFYENKGKNRYKITSFGISFGAYSLRLYQ